VHFISLTAHTFTHHYEHVSIVLGFRRIIGPHSSTLIENYIQYELDRLGIQPQQIISITTDNGSNMKKAAATLRFGNPISCMAHNLNLVVSKGLCLWSEPKQDNFPLEITLDLDEWQDIGGDLDYSTDTIEYDESSIDAAADFVSEEEDNVNNDGETDISRMINIESDGDDDIDVQFSSLVLNDKSSSSIDHYELLKTVFELMKKSRLIVKFMRNHNITNEYIKKYMLSKNNGRKTGGLILDMVIRWNSSYLLLDRLHKHKDVIHNICAFPNSIIGLTDQQMKRLNELILNEHEWELICCLKNVLEPFFDATEALSGQNYPTMALSFYVFRLLLHYFESTSKDDKITAALKQSLRYWFNIQCKAKLPAGQIEIMMVAAFLDPAFYRKMNDNDRKSAKKLIFKKLDKTNNSHPTSSSLLTSPSPPTTTTGKRNALEKLAAVCGYTISLATTTKQCMSVDEEISCYIKAAQTSNDFKEFWTTNSKQLPRLASLVRRVNIIPATSMSSEALFSVANFLHRKQRSSLSSRTLRYLLVLKNRNVLEKFE
ncbi:unnamed protein product, partial [Rotaria sordida]